MKRKLKFAGALKRQAAIARDWSVVAATIVRRSGRRSSVLDALF
jgi:hypothetical protein